MPFTFFPDACGGTETYVQMLAGALTRHDVTSFIAAPGPAVAHYSIEEIEVQRFPCDPTPTLATQYDGSDEIAARTFATVLESIAPDLVHFHAYTPQVTPAISRVAASHDIPLVYTYHTPTITCARGTLMRWGSEVCDGEMIDSRCSACTLNSLGVPRVAAILLENFHPLLQWLGTTEALNNIAVAVRIPKLVGHRNREVKLFLDRMQRVIVHADWSKRLLELNGIPGDKITVCRQGLRLHDERGATQPAQSESSLRLVFLGRMAPEKGLDLVLSAMARFPELDVKLDIFPTTEGESLSADPRVTFQSPVPHGQVVGLLRQYDGLVVPSRWLETGPLVVLEAFSAGTPVIGSNLGGISELVKEGVNGILVEPSEQGWIDVFKSMKSLRTELRSLRETITAPRSVDQLAAETAGIYAELLYPAGAVTGSTA